MEAAEEQTYILPFTSYFVNDFYPMASTERMTALQRNTMLIKIVPKTPNFKEYEEYAAW